MMYYQYIKKHVILMAPREKSPQRCKISKFLQNISAIIDF